MYTLFHPVLQNVEPFHKLSDSTQILPPCYSTMCLQVRYVLVNRPIRNEDAELVEVTTRAGEDDTFKVWFCRLGEVHEGGV